MPATRPISRTKGTSPTTVRSARRRNIPSPRSSDRKVIAPSEALGRLMKGNARYAANQPNERDFSHDRAERATAQYPIAAVLSCADSRVSPHILFDQGPGDVFVVRLAGNFLDDDGFAS